MTPTLMRDSINASQIPQDTPAVAGYGDGRYEWSSADWARFPNSIALSIVVDAANQGDILDVERYDASPADVPGWIDRFNRPGRRLPTIYCDRSTIDAVRKAAAGRPFDWWAATLDGTQDVPGAVAVQYVDANAYDESVILDPSWVGAGEEAFMALSDAQQQQILSDIEYIRGWIDQNGDPLLRDIQGRLSQIVSDVQAAGGTLTAAQAQELTELAAILNRIENSLKTA